MSKKIVFATFALISILSTPAFSADEHNTVAGLTVAGAPLGLHGVDPVSFIQLSNRIEGTAQYTARFEGVDYYFSSEANLNAFKKAPEEFSPQNGGFCTFGVSVGKKFDGNPRYSAIVDKKLYLFVNEDILKAFQKDPKGVIAKAEKSWHDIQHKSAQSL
ncbi:MAG: YHS domain-containing (seleno)protein [Methylophilaceae bacterium]